MVRFMADKNIKNPQDMKYFDRLGYSYQESLSTETEYIFERVPGITDKK